MADKIKQPKEKGVARTPTVMQLEALECGAASLAMVLAYYGRWIPLEQVRSDCGVSRDGSNAKSILKAARFYGLEAKGYRFEPQALKESGTFPCIIHWNFNHFVVLEGFKGGKALINDPAKGECAVSMKVFDDSFTGVCLTFVPGESFKTGGKPKSMVSFALRRLKGTGTAMLFTIITGIITSLMGVISPAFSRVFLDRLLTKKSPEWLIPFIVFLAVFDMLQILVTGLNSVYSLRLNGKMAAIGNADYMWKILRMPLGFFSQRMAGDIQGRQASNASIAKTLIDTLAPLALNCVTMVFYLVVMLRYNIMLTIVGVASLSINAWISRVISKKRVNITRVAMRDTSKLNSATASGIEMIETIKSSGSENGYFAKWAGYQAGANSQQVKFSKVNVYLGMIPQFVSTIANSAVLVLGVFLVLKGEFTVGMVMAFQGLLTSFMTPAMTLVSAGQTIQEMRTQMERVDDVMQYPDDDAFPDNITDETEDCEKLTGNIELRNIEFGYSPLAAPLIRDFNLTMTPGKSVAIVGGSGCGKSTVANLVSGLFHPWKGEILFDGIPINEIDKNIFRGSLAVVDQEIILFEDTISNNIKMWDNSIEDFEMILAARDARIHDDIMQRPEGYQHKLRDGGRDFSGGQRQRIEIARVLAQDPTIIILDEATSALDAKTEFEVVKAIKNRGITCIVIAHRLSTVRSCDEILVMNKGIVVDRGTHDELLEKCELYKELVTSE